MALPVRNEIKLLFESFLQNGETQAVFIRKEPNVCLVFGTVSLKFGENEIIDVWNEDLDVLKMERRFQQSLVEVIRHSHETDIVHIQTELLVKWSTFAGNLR